MCFNPRGDISTLNGSSLKLLDEFTYLGNSISSAETDINTWPAKAWTAIDRLSVIWKSDLTDKMKCVFFQKAVVSILLVWMHTTWMLTKCMEKKLDASYTRMLRTIMNKSWRQQPTKQQLYSHSTLITKTIQDRRTRHAGLCWRSRDELKVTFSLGPHHIDEQRQDDQLEQLCPDTGCSLEDLPVARTIEKCGGRGSGISVLMVRHDDDDI